MKLGIIAIVVGIFINFVIWFVPPPSIIFYQICLSAASIPLTYEIYDYIVKVRK